MGSEMCIRDRSLSSVSWTRGARPRGNLLYGQTWLETPDPVRSPKLSNHGRVQYSGGGPPGKSTYCTVPQHISAFACAVKFRSLRFHSPRLCRVAVFLYKPTSLDISRHQRLSPLVEQGTETSAPPCFALCFKYFPCVSLRLCVAVGSVVTRSRRNHLPRLCRFAMFTNQHFLPCPAGKPIHRDPKTWKDDSNLISNHYHMIVSEVTRA